MKTREKFPFIYFFLEPNVVLVYKIEELQYLTVDARQQSGEWQTFELNNADEFESFDHEQSTPLIGRGYFFSQDMKNKMIKKINNLLHRHRKAASISKLQGENNAGSVHLVCSESTAGALRYGLDRPNTVLAFQAYFAIGPIWQLDRQNGKAERFDWLNENINLEQEQYELENKFNNCLFEIAEIPEYVPIYIWTANNGDEQTGLRFLLHLVRNKANKLVLLNTTELFARGSFTKEDEHQHINHSGEVHPDSLKLLFEQNKMAKPLSELERKQFQKEWETLAQSKGVLRKWQNGRIVGRPEDDYDLLIIKTLERMHNEQEKKDFIRTGRVIGDIIGQLDEVISDAFLEYRIRHLIYSGVLELKGVPRSMRHYSIKLNNKRQPF